MSEQSMFILSIGSCVIGIAGLIFALIEARGKRKLKTMYEEKSSTRCKDLSTIVESLTGDLRVACNIANTNCADSTGPCVRLSGKIDSARGLNQQLIRFCERLNEEHLYEFKHLVDENLMAKMELADCIDELAPKPLVTRKQSQSK